MASAEMNTEDIAAVQKQLGLSDSRMATALGITRQTWRNWRTGRTIPLLARNAIVWMMELRKLSPANDNLPDRIRHLIALALCLLAPELALMD